MKKLYIYSLCSLAFASLSFAADDIVTISGEDSKTEINCNDIVFTGNGPLNVTKNITVLEGIRVGDDNDLNKVINAEIKGASDSCIYLNNTNGDAYISGVSAEKSSLDFSGYHLSTKRDGKDVTPAFGCLGLTIQNITLDFNPVNTNGALRAGKFVLDGAVVNLNSGNGLNITRNATVTGAAVTLTNGSKLTIGEGLGYKTIGADTANTVAAEDKFFVLNGGSSLVINESSFSMGGFGFKVSENSTITTKSLTNAGSLELTNSTFTANGTVSVSSMTLTGTNTIAGSGSFSASGTTMLSDKTIYINVAKFSGTVGSETKDTKLYIGQDAEQGNSAIKVSYNGTIGFNQGALELRGDSVIGDKSRGELRLNSPSARSYFGTGTKVYATHSRIASAYIDGLIDVNAKQMAGEGWDYALSFGVYSTGSRPSHRGNVVLNTNAQVNVNPDVATYFGVYGDVVSNAGVGALKSNANAPLMIYGDSILTLNTKDAFAVGGKTSQAESTFNFYDGSTAKLVIDDVNNIGSLNLGDDATLTIEFDEDGKLVLGGTDTAKTADLNSLMGDLTAGCITLTGDIDLKIYSIEGKDVREYFKTVDGRVLEFVTNDNGVSYIVTSSVPEPAQWAVIFGAIAFGFIIYRKRRC